MAGSAGAGGENRQGWLVDVGGKGVICIPNPQRHYELGGLRNAAFLTDPAPWPNRNFTQNRNRSQQIRRYSHHGYIHATHNG
jgi:hypothetical protein